MIDEILAVGDEGFQQKCFARLREFQEEDKTIVIVSHDLTSIQQFSQRAFYIKSGYIVASGKPEKVINSYLNQTEG